MSFIFDSLSDKILDRSKCVKEYELFVQRLNQKEQDFLLYTLNITFNLFGENNIESLDKLDSLKVFNSLNDKNLRYLLHNIQKTHYIINNKNDSFDRVKPYYVTERILGRSLKSENDSLCKFELMKEEMKSELLGKGMGGITYKVSHDKLPKPIVAKVMDMTDENNMQEIEYYERLKNLVLTYKTPHLPLTWTNMKCGNKCVFINIDDISSDLFTKKRWEIIKRGKCALVFAELFNGDLNKNRPKTKDDLFSLIFQIICGLYVLDKENLYHGDLNSGNVLYLNLDQVKDVDQKEYIKYKYGNKTFYIKHNKKLWSLWDFEYMNTKGKRIHENFDPDYFVDNGFFSQDVMDLIQRIWGEYNDEKSQFISGSWYFDLLDIVFSLTFLTRGSNELSKIVKKIYDNVLSLFIKNDLSMNPIQSIPFIFEGVDYLYNNIYVEGENKEKDEKSISTFTF